MSKIETTNEQTEYNGKNIADEWEGDGGGEVGDEEPALAVSWSYNKIVCHGKIHSYDLFRFIIFFATATGGKNEVAYKCVMCTDVGLSFCAV